MTSPVAQNRDVNVTVNATVDPYVKSMAAANDVTLKLVDGLKKLDDKIQSVVKKAGLGMAGAGTGGLLGMLGSAREAAQLEKSFESLSAATVRSGESMDRLVSGAKNLSREIPVSTQHLAGLMTQVKALGIDGVNNITRLTRVSAELSAATNTAPGQLFTGLAELGRSMGNSVQNIERYGSAVTALTHEMGVAPQGIVGFANQIQAVANKAGVAESQVLGLSAAFQRVGADGYAGATAFNTVVNNMTDAIATNSSALNTYGNLLGMTREQFAALGQENPTEAFVQFVEAVQAQGPRATQTLQRFGLDGVRTQRVFAALTSGQADLRGALGLSSRAYEENSATAQSAAEAWDGTADSFEKAKNSAANLATTIGGPMSDALQPVIDGVGKTVGAVDSLITTLNDLPGPFKNLGSNILTGTFGLLAIGGAFTAISWSAIKFLAIWRMVSGTLGIQAFRGINDGLRGTARSLDGVSRTGTTLYGVSRAVAGGISGRGGGDGTPGAATSRATMVAGTVGRGARAVALFPLTRMRQMGGELLDTARHPFRPELRNPMRTDPWSAYGGYQMGERAARRAAEAMRNSQTWASTTAMAGAGMAQARMAAQVAQARIMGMPGADRAQGMASGAYQRVSGWGSSTAQAMQARLRERSATPAAPADRASQQATSRFTAASAMASRSMTAMSAAASTSAAAVTSGLGSLARGMGSFLMGPWGILAMVATPLLIGGFQKLASAADRTTEKLAYTGAEMAERLGRDFVTPQQRRENDRDRRPSADQDPFGAAETQDARSGAFQEAYRNTLDQIDAADSRSAQMARLQLEVNRGVQQNNGAPLDNAQQAEVRQLMISTFGLSGARSAYPELDLTGRTPANFYQSNMKSLDGASGDDANSLRGAISSNVITDYMEGNTASMAYALAQSANDSGYKDRLTRPASDTNIASSESVQKMIDTIISDFNEQNPGSKINLPVIDDLDAFMGALELHNGASRRLADDLRDAGLVVDSSGKVTAESLDRLASAAAGTATALEVTPMADALGATRLNQTWQEQTGDPKAYITTALSNPDAIDYQQNLNKILELAGNANGIGDQGNGDTSLFSADASDRVRERIRQLTELKNVIGDPNDPSYQAMDKLLGTAYSQLGQVSSSVSSAPWDAVKQFSAAFAELDVTDPLNADQFEASKAQLESMVSANLGTLMGYYQQIRSANRQRLYSEEDHNRQLRKMDRDFGLQMAESHYQRGEQVRLANYSYAEQQRQAAYSYSESLRNIKNSYDEVFGNPAAFVQSKYTQGASSSLLGMERQVEYLQRSLTGIGNLRGMGVSTDVIKLLGLDDPTNFQQVEKYLVDFASNPQMVERFNATIQERMSIQQALASDPSNSQLVELDRQFQHSADEAARAFTHAAEESLKAFDHSMTLANEGYQRGVNDMVESYDIGTTRAMAEIARIGESTAMSTQALLKWASDSGIVGIQNLGTATGDAINTINIKTAEMVAVNFNNLNTQIAAAAQGIKDTLSRLFDFDSQAGGANFGMSGWLGNLVNGINGAAQQLTGNRGGFGGIFTGGGGNAGGGFGGGGSGYFGGDGGVSPQGQSVVNNARRWIGTMYKWGGESEAEGGVDCSGLIIDAYRKAGLPFQGRPIASSLGRMGRSIPVGQAAPGDVLYYDNPGPTDHVAIVSGNGRMIEAPTVGQRVRETTIRPPTSARRMYANGAVFDARSDITVGEAGPETVLPLNAHGAEFVARTIQASLRLLHVDTNLADLRRQRGGQAYATPQVSRTEYHHVDQSTTYGDVTVMASDPREMQRKLDAQKRAQALTRPMARR